MARWCSVASAAEDRSLALIEACEAAPGQLLAIAARYPGEFPLWLESAVEGPLSGWSLLLAASGEVLRLRADGRVEKAGADGAADLLPAGTSFLDALDRWVRECPGAIMDSPLPFLGGWALYLGYELAGEIEPRLALPAPRPDEIVAAAIRAPAAFVHEHATGRSWLVCEPEHAALASRLRGRLSSLATAPDAPAVARPEAVQLDEEDPARFLAGVERALDYIAAGDVYQVNLSRGWSWRTTVPVAAVDAYRALRAANPAPFAGLLQLPGMSVVSSSPERLVRTTPEWVETRPIAGTRPRSRRAGAEAGEKASLRANAKEQAEHVMLIDLERNDLGRICQAGSVEVDEFMIVESYQHVHHLVSNVRGRLRPGASAGAVIRAVFPGGTITGCPKFRCMQIIGEIEAAPRGAYTGAFGYLGRDGRMDLNILIRTLLLRECAIEFRAGAGIVADSDPGRELAETRAKAEGLLRALRSPIEALESAVEAPQPPAQALRP